MSFWFISTASDETGKSKSPSPPPSKATKSITRGQRAAATRVEKVCSILCDDFLGI